MYVHIQHEYHFRSGKTKAISTDEFMVRQYTVVSLGPSKPLSYTEATLPLCKAHNGTTRISGRRWVHMKHINCQCKCKG